MTIKRKACIAGAYEHPTRKAPDKTVAQLHAECARGALADAGLTLQDARAGAARTSTSRCSVAPWAWPCRRR